MSIKLKHKNSPELYQPATDYQPKFTTRFCEMYEKTQHKDVVITLMNEHGKVFCCNHPGAIGETDSTPHICLICHPEQAQTDELYICRKISFGNNGNLVRYAPIDPRTLNKKSFLARLVNSWRNGRGSI